MKAILLKTAVLAIISVSFFSSCSKDNNNVGDTGKIAMSEQEACKQFAIIISKALANEQSLRTYIKKEAITQFDGTYDVVYALHRNAKVSDCTFDELLLQYCGSSSLDNILKTVPEINITIPNWGIITGETPEQWDTTREEVLVGYENVDNNTFDLFDNGRLCAQLKCFDIPCVQTLVVTKNERVRIIHSTKTNESVSFVFTNPAFALSHCTKGTWYSRDIDLSGWGDSDLVPSSEIDARVIDAYNEFKNYSGPACQRDYIYYGMTKQIDQGIRDDNVRERIYRFRLTKALYNVISDSSSDPALKEYMETSDSTLTPWTQTLARKLWTNGSFLFDFEFFKADSSATQIFPEKLTVPVLPYEAYDITSCHEHYLNKTWFNKGKYYYSATAFNLHPRWIYIPGNYYLSPWNLTTQSGTIYIRLIERDASESIQESENKQFVYTGNTQHKVTVDASGNVKAFDIKAGYGYQGTEQTQWTKTQSIQKTKIEGSDELGNGPFDYKSKVIIGQGSEEVNGVSYSGYRLNSISLGSVELTVLPCRIN